MTPRRALAILIALLLGAAVNILIAWYCSTRVAPDHWTISGISPVSGSFLAFNLSETRGRARCIATATSTERDARTAMDAAFSGGGIPKETFFGHASPPRWLASPSLLHAPPQSFQSIASGWPMLSMVSHQLPTSPGPRTFRDRFFTGLERPTSFWRRQYLPLLPIWPGFAINTALYALPCLALILSLAAARKSLRRKRGHCPECNYDRAGLAAESPCPECGSLLSGFPS